MLKNEKVLRADNEGLYIENVILEDNEITTTDGTHVNEAGSIVTGNKLADFIKSIFGLSYFMYCHNQKNVIILMDKYNTREEENIWVMGYL